jgi:hypothetical protein
MSIRDEILARTQETPERLFFLPPLIRSVGLVREIFISDEVNAVAHPPWPATALGRRHAQMRGYLDAFTEGRRITATDAPYRKPKSTFLARVDPVSDDFFSMRCIDPKPGLRVLGAFAAFDLFVALTWNCRENLPSDDPLNKPWRDEIERCKAAWRRLFYTYPPHHGSSLNAYLSNFTAV